jgi:hypothetical protein
LLYRSEVRDFDRFLDEAGWLMGTKERFSTASSGPVKDLPTLDRMIRSSQHRLRRALSNDDEQECTKC